MDRFAVFSIPIVIVTISFTMQAFGQLEASTTPNEPVAIRDLLRKIGEKYDCHFTLEIGITSRDRLHSLAAQKLDLEPQKKTLNEELEWLRKNFPGFTYEYSKYNRRVIHLINGRLTQEKSYSLNKTVPTISFSGTLFDLVNEIGKMGIAVSSRGLIDTYEALGLDMSAEVHVNEKHRIVRDILTNALNLSERGRVLWIAETEIGKNKTTYVRYLSRNM